MGSGYYKPGSRGARGFLARVKAQQAAGRARAVVLRLPKWLSGETEDIETTRIELAAAMTRAAQVPPLKIQLEDFMVEYGL